MCDHSLSSTGLVEVFAKLKFKTGVRQVNQAAALYLPRGAEGSLALYSNFFDNYADEHSQVWVKHMASKKFDFSQKDLLLVTGHYLTDCWAMAVKNDVGGSTRLGKTGSLTTIFSSRSESSEEAPAE